MNALTKEWIEKAEEDYRVCQRELRVRRGACFDAVGFHAQQCAEKYLKALLQDAGIKFPKTHELEKLIHLVVPAFPQFASHEAAAKLLSTHAVEVRYPGKWATRADADASIQTAREIRKAARTALGLVRVRAATKPRRSTRRK